MKSLRIVWGIVRKFGGETGLANEACFDELYRLAISDQTYFPVYAYLQILQRLGLINYSGRSKEIKVTEKGMTTERTVLLRLKACMLLFFYSLRWAFLWMAMWPALMAIQVDHRTEQGK